MKPLLFALLIFASAAETGAPAQPQTPPPADPRVLVQQMVDNELHSTDRTTWRYREDTQEADGLQTYEVIETAQGKARKLLLTNGQPAGADRIRAIDADNDRLLNDPDYRAKQQKSDHDQAQQAERMLKLLPDGFVYTCDPSSTANTIVLHFEPNPQFQPPSSEAKVFHAMRGTLEIDAKQMWMVHLSGTLISDVNFGGGIFAKIKKGGTFDVRQTEIAPGHWMVTALAIHIDGRALIKTITVRDNFVLSDFQSIPPDLTLSQAIDLLRQ